MLSVATLKSAAQASNYYQQGDYYTKDEQEKNSQWFGKGAHKLGLEGTADADTFKKMLEGKLPNGEEMHKGYNAKGEPLHRPGYDLTFSAVKSASILALIGGDENIVDAHQGAVVATLKHIEKEACARVKVNGTVEQQLSQNLVGASFLHKASRLLDPNIHTHCVIFNMTEIADKWRSLYGDDYYTLKKSLGLHYRMEFAQRLIKLGYELEQTSNEGFFEIQHEINK